MSPCSQPKPARFVAALQAAEQEDRRQAQRDRDDRRAEIVLVLVLMQRHAGAGLVAVDQARIRRKAVKPRLGRRLCGQRAKRCRHGRPRCAGFRIDAVVAIAAAVGDPAGAAAIGHRHRHRMAARRHHVAKRRLRHDRVDAQRSVRLRPIWRSRAAARRRPPSLRATGADRERFQTDRPSKKSALTSHRERSRQRYGGGRSGAG